MKVNLLNIALIFVLFNACKKDTEETVEPTQEEIYLINESIVEQQSEWTPSGSTNWNFINPSNIQLTDNYVYIQDYGNNPISLKRFNKSGNFIDEINLGTNFYTYQNQLFFTGQSELNISKYNEDFSLITSLFNSTTSLEQNWFSTGSNSSCLINANLEGIEYINFQDSSRTFIGSQGNGPLQFGSSITSMDRNGNLYYCLDGENNRIQILNANGTYHSELNYNSSELIKSHNTLTRVCMNDNYIFLVSSENQGDEIQVFNKSDFTYKGYITLGTGEISKNTMTCDNDKLYVASNSPSKKVYVIDLY